MRMYLRYADQHVSHDALQNDTLAGIKSCTIVVMESRIWIFYAKSGVCIDSCAYHRLTCGKRQTSFAAAEVVPDKVEVNIDP